MTPGAGGIRPTQTRPDVDSGERNSSRARPIGSAWYHFPALVARNQLSARPPRRYLRTPVPVHFPVHFPEHEIVGESSVHLRLRTGLFLVIEQALQGRAFVGSDQFVYWDPTTPSACVSPDVVVRLGGPLSYPTSFKAWEHGAPNLGVEIISASDDKDRDWEDKLARYRRCGIGEVVRFDPEDDERPLRLWDLVDGDMVERDPREPDALFCDTLGAYWTLREHPAFRRELRVANRSDGSDLWPSPVEAERLAKEAERLAKEAALARVAELERELARRG